jgi:hypothetical protein
MKPDVTALLGELAELLKLAPDCVWFEPSPSTAETRVYALYPGDRLIRLTLEDLHVASTPRNKLRNEIATRLHEGHEKWLAQKESA